MPKKLVTINKTSQGKITKWIDTFIASSLAVDIKKFADDFNNVVLNELRTHKECTEQSVVNSMIQSFTDYIITNNIETWDDVCVDEAVNNARHILANKYTSNKKFNDNIDVYFNEVKREYILHPLGESDELEFIPENRDIFIKNNLKLVIACAKRYRNLGVPFEDLIQTGNYGLCVAFEKFDKNRANLRTAIMNSIDASGKTHFDYDTVVKIITKSFIYDKDLERTLKSVPKDGFGSIESFKTWVKTNVKTAMFASVAFQWIKAYILMELTKMSSVVRIPKANKSSKNTDEETTDDYADYIIEHNKTVSQPIVSLDSVNPYTNDNYHDNQILDVANKAFMLEDNNIDEADNRAMMQDIVYKAIAGLSDINRRIIKKRFGLGYPCGLNIVDIAESEGLTVNRVKYIVASCLNELSTKISDKDKKLLVEILGTTQNND
jgi:DNA-directed RNA polymerase sigma subunit (sigma70/sigma32)